MKDAVSRRVRPGRVGAAAGAARHAMTRRPWRVGDRAVWPHRERGRRVLSTGVVGAVDEPGLPRGVRLVFDEPVNGGADCYATHDELLTPAEAVRLP